MGSVVKSALGAPIRQLICCVPLEQRDPKARRNSAPHRPRMTAAELQRYQRDLEQERRKREERSAQKNAQRAAMRSHFRQKYQLAQNAKDDNHLNMARGKVVLPRELAAMVRSEVPAPQDRGFNLLGTFRGLSLGGFQSSMQRATEQCTLM
ncbi:complexin-3-like [Lepisosteus oculatus]|uniref:complexin-3-like n=1 Tax=Lepisosteus oculatus TaxID=7918 RepID=UPI00371ECFE4